MPTEQEVRVVIDLTYDQALRLSGIIAFNQRTKPQDGAIHDAVNRAIARYEDQAADPQESEGEG